MRPSHLQSEILLADAAVFVHADGLPLVIPRPDRAHNRSLDLLPRAVIRGTVKEHNSFDMILPIHAVENDEVDGIEQRLHILGKIATTGENGVGLSK